MDTTIAIFIALVFGPTTPRIMEMDFSEHAITQWSDRELCSGIVQTILGLLINLGEYVFPN